MNDNPRCEVMGERIRVVVQLGGTDYVMTIDDATRLVSGISVATRVARDQHRARAVGRDRCPKCSFWFGHAVDCEEMR